MLRLYFWTGNAGGEITLAAVLTDTVLLIMLHVNTLQKADGINSREVKKACGDLFVFPAARIFIIFTTQTKAVSKRMPRHSHHDKAFTHMFFS